ncbi:hypothetical protein D3C72_1034420 [compost metagenome]
MFGLLLHAAFQAGVQILQSHGHAVEAPGDGAELITPAVRHPRRQVARLHARQSGLQPRQRAKHQQLRRIHERQGRCNGQRHHRELRNVEQGGPARELLLDGPDQPVHAADKCFGLLRNGGRLRCVAACNRLLPRPAQHLPALLHRLQGRARGLVARHKQGPGSVAALQQGEAGVELADQQRHTLWISARQGLCQLPGLHAHAPGLVDGGSPTFEGPSEPQRQANGDERHQEQRTTNGADLDRQRTYCDPSAIRVHGATSWDRSARSG